MNVSPEALQAKVDALLEDMMDSIGDQGLAKAAACVFRAIVAGNSWCLVEVRFPCLSEEVASWLAGFGYRVHPLPIREDGPHTEQASLVVCWGNRPSAGCITDQKGQDT